MTAPQSVLISNNQLPVPQVPFTYATLPTAAYMGNYAPGTQAYTTDRGMCAWNGATWNTLATASYGTQSFQWSASTICTVASPSSSIQAPTTNLQTFVLTALTGVTTVIAQIQGSADNTNWATLGVIQLNAAGSDQIQSTMNYAYLRVNVVTLTGGYCSCTVSS